jgi:thiaminase
MLHPFLKAAANGSLDPSLLALWLSQDRIYAMHAYPRFIGALIAKINFNSMHGISSPEELMNRRILKMLTFSLDAVMKEADFFESTAQKFGLPLDGWKERKGTRDYSAEMCRVATTMKIEEGLAFLWAMEKVSGLGNSNQLAENLFLLLQVYLDAWSCVDNGLAAVSMENPSKRCVAPFAKNWSSPQFITFVNNLASLVDDLGIEPGTETWVNAEQIWNRVVELEAEFWPNAGEEKTQRVA